jgi:hypothetical protein
LSTKTPKREQGVHVVLLEKKPTADQEHEYQLWKFTPDGFVQNVATGLVLDLEGDPENAQVKHRFHLFLVHSQNLTF